MSSFIFTTSQVGAEPIIKEEIVDQFPEARLAFSRPGLLTFKLPDENIQALQKMEVPLKSVFARTWGYSIGSVRGETVEEILPKLWELTGVEVGATTVLSCILPSSANVSLIMDRGVAEAEWFACTDGTPTCFVKLHPQDLLQKYIPASGHSLTLI